MGFISEYKKSLKLIDVEEVLDLIFYRPLAFLFVKSILSTNITPNQVTLASVFFGIIGSILIWTGDETLTFAAGFLIITYNVLDCSDGQLARIKKNGSELGRIIDGIGDYVVSVAGYLAIGFGFASNSENPSYYWSFVVAAGASNILQAGLVDYYRNRYLDYAFDRESLLEDSLEDSKEKWEIIKKEKGQYFEKFVYWIYILYSSVQMKFSSGKEADSEKKYDKTEFLRKNRVMIHLWTYLGPTTQWTLFIIAAFLNRFDLYLYAIVIIGNIMAVTFIITQKLINKNLKLAEAK